MPKPTHRFSLPLTVVCVLATLVLTGCGDSGNGSSSDADENPVHVAYVTNGIASFWSIAEKGAQQAGEDLGVRVTVLKPPNGVEDQKRMCQDMLAQGIDGIAISPIDPDNQGDLLKEISDNTLLITTDADAPDSDRKCYVGMDNYTAGRACGELVKEALPEGGNIVIFVGRLGQLNARLRRQGVIDELLDREPDAARYDDPTAGVIEGDRFTILDTRTDGFDFGKAKAQVQDAIAKYENLAGMVGLFEYNPPLMLDAVREAGKLDQIKIIAFDENVATLDGIEAGDIIGTVVQNPYQYGYESIRILSELAQGEDVIPEGGFPYIPYRVIRQDNVGEFRVELEGLMSGDNGVSDSEETHNDAPKPDTVGRSPESNLE